MILVDFRNWKFDKSFGYLSNTQNKLLEREFDTLKKLGCFMILELFVAQRNRIAISDIFFENKKAIAVSSVNNLSDFFESIDKVLDLKNKEVIDYTEAAEEEVYFYGSSSLVVHKKSEIALCGVNTYSDESLFDEYCEDFEFTPFSFELPEGMFTRDMAFFVKDILLICLDYITDKKKKKQLLSFLKSWEITVISFTKEQVEKGAFNLISFEGGLMMTKEVCGIFTEKQKEALQGVNVKIIELPFLDKAGVLLRNIIFSEV